MSSIVGIDLGTTNSAIAMMDGTGRPTIIENTLGSSMTPSVVAIVGDGSEPIVGEDAKVDLALAPEFKFAAFKREMDTGDQRLASELPGTSPVELSSAVLKSLLADAKDRAVNIGTVVISVPANFANEARVATVDAATLAGLDGVHLVNEPTAALFYYSLERTIAGIAVVYDFGGGTLDVSVARVDGRDVEILTSRGDHKLGGLDFDAKLEELIEEKVREESGSDAEFDLGRTIEEYKKQLTTRTEINVQATSPDFGREIVTVTREEFEQRCSSLIARAEMVFESALQDAGVEPEEVVDVFLVGGSSRMPMVRAHIESFMGRPPVCYVNPDEVVALGAALYSGTKSDPEALNAAQSTVVGSMQLQDVANHFFGTTILSESVGRLGIQVDTIIPKNTPIPCSVTRSYYTVSEGQTQVRCDVTQSSTRESDPDFVRIIWEGELGPLPDGREPNCEVQVTFAYDENQIMRCSFEDVESGITQEVEIGITGTATDTSDLEDLLLD